jgi:hypothetical protein
MADERLIVAIGRIERALTRLETLKMPSNGDGALIARYETLKSETRAVIRDIDALLTQGGQ